MELARLLYWWEALSSQTIDPCTDCGSRLCKCPASAFCDCVCSSLCSCSREETGARERLWGAFLEASDCVYAISEFSDARWATYRVADRDSAGAKGESKRRLVSPGQAMEEAAATAAEAARAAAKWQRAASALAREVRRVVRQRGPTMSIIESLVVLERLIPRGNQSVTSRANGRRASFVERRLRLVAAPRERPGCSPASPPPEGTSWPSSRCIGPDGSPVGGAQQLRLPWFACYIRV